MNEERFPQYTYLRSIWKLTHMHAHIFHFTNFVVNGPGAQLSFDDLFPVPH